MVDQVGDIVGVVKDAVVVIGPAGFHLIVFDRAVFRSVSHPLSVDIKVINTEGSRIHFCRNDLVCGLKLLAEDRGALLGGILEEESAAVIGDHELSVHNLAVFKRVFVVVKIVFVLDGFDPILCDGGHFKVVKQSGLTSCA